ncbi:MAG: hypothetical protein ABFS28_08630 [Bacteroidota bacterium]
MYTKKLTFIIPLLLWSALIFSHPPDEPNTTSDVSWHSIRLIEFQTGSLDDAKQIIKKFESASEAAGLPATSIRWFESGKYDLVVIWELDQEPKDSEWNWSPMADVWWDSLVAQEGSEEAAKQIQDLYTSLVASTVTNIARKSK